jgi:hypothetical protein
MSWRNKAIELLPEFRAAIRKADNVMTLWTDLYLGLEDAYEEVPPKEDVIKRIYDFARWCMNNGMECDDPRTAVSVAFYEHLPTNAKVRAGLRKNLSQEEFMALKSLFQYFLSQSEYADFEREFLAGVQP